MTLLWRRLGGWSRAPVALVAAIAFVLPVYWMFITSIKTGDEVMAFPPNFFPFPGTTEPYLEAWTRIPMLRFFLNNIIVTGAVLLLQLPLVSLAAYAFSTFEFRFKKALFTLVLLAMMIPGQATFLPNFILVKNLGILNTFAALILPFASSAYGIFLLRQAFMQVPKDLINAAELDGANHFQVLGHVMLPIVKRPVIALVASLTAALVALTGCGGSATQTDAQKPAASEPKTEAPKSAEPVNIEFWYAIGGKGGETIKALAKKFNDSQKEVVVTPVYQGDYYANHQKMSTGIAAGTIPAVSMVEVASVAFFADNGALADLSGFAKTDDAMIKDFLPGLMKEATYKGKLVSIPFNRSTPILYINKNALKDAGLNPEGPKNWDELRDYAKKLTVVKDGQVERWGFLTPVDIWFYEALVFQQGGSFISADGKKATFNDEAGQSALQFWVDLIHADKSMEMPQGEKYNAWDVSTKAFTSGKAAMIFSTTGRLLSHINGAGDKFEVGTAFLPAGKKGFGTPTGGANLVVMAAAPKAQQEAGWKFIKFLSQPENAAEFSTATGYVPVNNGAVKKMDEMFTKYPQFMTAIKQLEYAQPRPQHPAYAQLQETIKKGLQKAVLGEQTPKAALDEAAELSNKALK